MITDERSTTVAPESSACWRSSVGTHLAGRPKTGSRVGSPGSRLEVRRRWRGRCPAGACAAADLDPVRAGSRRCDGGRSRLSRVRTGGMTMPRSVATLRRKRLDPVEQVAAAGGVDQVDQVERRARARAGRPGIVGRASRLGACPAAAGGILGAPSATALASAVRLEPLADDEQRRRRRARNGSLGRPGTRHERERGAAGDPQRARAGGRAGRPRRCRCRRRSPARVTMRPVETESSRAGICETRPSPTLSRL